MSGVVWHPTKPPRAERWGAAGARGATVWLTGLSGSGKSTVADAVALRLTQLGLLSYTLDGDNLRHGLNADLTFSREDRQENVRRVGEVARLLADAGVLALVPVISPYREDRQRVRAIHEAAQLVFCEVFLSAPLDVCESRDPKGLYRQARAGEITGFTGIDDPYEAPEHPDVVLDAGTAPERAAVMVLAALEKALGSPLAGAHEDRR